GGLALLEPAVVPQQEHAIEQLGVVADRDARLAARDRLLALEAEAAEVAPRADRAALVGRAVRVRAVLDERDAVPLGDLGEAVHRRRVAPQVHDDDGARARGDAPLD